MHTSIGSSSTTSAKMIDLQEEYFFVIDILRKFEAKIYKYTKHSHRARWQDLQFKKYRDFFPPGTIWLIVDFAENYIFVAQNEIQSEYYHYGQVSMIVHILYRRVEQNVDHIESTSENRHVIKEYHVYISDDHTHDTHFVQHRFDKIYDSFKGRGIKFNEH